MQREQVQNLVEFGWRLPLKLVDTRQSTRELKCKQEWDKLDNKGSEVNAWAPYSII